MDGLAGRLGRRPYDKSSRANARQCGRWRQQVLCEADGHRRDRGVVGYLGGGGLWPLGRYRYPRRAETGTRSSFSVAGALKYHPRYIVRLPPTHPVPLLIFFPPTHTSRPSPDLPPQRLLGFLLLAIITQRRIRRPDCRLLAWALLRPWRPILGASSSSARQEPREAAVPVEAGVTSSGVGMTLPGAAVHPAVKSMTGGGCSFPLGRRRRWLSSQRGGGQRPRGG